MSEPVPALSSDADQEPIASSGTAPRAPVGKPRLPPRWFIRFFWFTHRRVYQLTGGRLGLWRPKPGGWGVLCLTTVGRRTGVERRVMIGYFEDGPTWWAWR
jgi:hypothetical protein